jgi:hypothetical protein
LQQFPPLIPSFAEDDKSSPESASPTFQTENDEAQQLATSSTRRLDASVQSPRSSSAQRPMTRRLYCQKASLASRPALRMPKFADSMANSVCSAAPDTSCNTPACTTAFHSSAIAADSTATVSRTYGLSPGVIEVANGPWRDWQCPCGYLNFERRTNCLHCSKPRLRPVQSPSAGSQCYLQ